MFMSKMNNSPTERIENYLETIYQVTQRKKFAQAKDIVEILGVRPPSVTEMFRKLKKKGYINYEKYSGVTLTQKGESVASEIHLKHQILRDFLMILDIDAKTALEEASEIQHSVSEETIEKLILFIDFVKKSKKTGGWIDHLEYFFKTGKYVECQPANRDKCPVHSWKQEMQ